MRRWAFLTAFLYGLLAVLMIFPLIMTAFPLEILKDIDNFLGDILDNVVSWPGYWIATIGIMALIQVLYLAVPLRVARERPVGRRHWGYLAAATGIMFGTLVFGAWCVVTETLFGEGALESDAMVYQGLTAGGVSWLVWGIVFYILGRRSADPLKTVGTASDALLRGSILEILVAVPSHVLARHRDYCCAGFLTFLGLASGLATMLFAYGPGVFFLFAERWGRLTRRPASLSRRPALQRHGWDSLVWILSAGAFITVCTVPKAVSGIVGGSVSRIEDWQFGLGLIGFVVMCIVALIHVVMAWVRREPRRKFTLVVGILAVEFLVWMVWMWPDAVRLIE
jgi:hypothetical protein